MVPREQDLQPTAREPSCGVVQLRARDELHRRRLFFVQVVAMGEGPERRWVGQTPQHSRAMAPWTEKTSEKL